MKLVAIMLTIATSLNIATAGTVTANETCLSGVDLTNPKRDPITSPYDTSRLNDYQTVDTFKYSVSADGSEVLAEYSLVGKVLPDLNRMMYLVDVTTGKNIVPYLWKYCFETENPANHRLVFSARLQTGYFGAGYLELQNYSIIAVNYVPVDPEFNTRPTDPLSYETTVNESNEPVRGYNRAEPNNVPARGYRRAEPNNIPARGYVRAEPNNIPARGYRRAEPIDRCANPFGYYSLPKPGCPKN